MIKLKIRNFGPIQNGFSENDGYLEISPVTVICGNLATGKSTIAKLYSTCTWIEKKFNSEESIKTIAKNLFQELLDYHKIGCYLKKNTEIQYIGKSCKISYMDSKVNMELINDTDYKHPKILYIPVERNLCTSIVNSIALKGVTNNICDFFSDYMNAVKSLKKSKYKLPLNGYEYRYNSATNTFYIENKSKDIEIDFLNASSGLQSLLPIALTSAYYSQFISDDKVSNEKFSFDQERFYSSFINIVENPEQNLHPVSQVEILYFLLKCFNTQSHNTSEQIENKLLITTHSPYILAYLTQSAKAAELLEKGVLEKEIEKIVPLKAAVPGDKIHIYETKEDGSIKLLEPYENLPSDENELNKALEEQNENFSELLELETKFCK